jgi:hypothetical protein
MIEEFSTGLPPTRDREALRRRSGFHATSRPASRLSLCRTVDEPQANHSLIAIVLVAILC